MKQTTFKYITGTIFILGIVSFLFFHKMETNAAREALSKNAIRFHVLANSDSVLDQSLKMKVKEAVVDYIYHNTASFDTVEETKVFLTRHDARIKKIAREVVEKNGYPYTVDSTFGKDNFPNKSYGDVTFPAGEYTSYTLSIGSGKGHNWWCVLYPPLCFVDASSGVVPDNSKKRLKESLTDTEYEAVTEYRFKYLTFLNKFL